MSNDLDLDQKQCSVGPYLGPNCLQRLEQTTKLAASIRQTVNVSIIIWASSRETLSLGFPSKRVLNQSPQLQRLARKLKFHL